MLTFKLNRRLYLEDGVKDALLAFAECGRPTLTQDGDYHVISVEDVGEYAPEVWQSEFCNYALAACIERDHA